MSEALAVPGDDDSRSALEAAGAVVTETSLKLTDPDLPWEDYEKLGSFLGQMNRACSWWIGDLILFGEAFYGHRYAQIEDAIGLAPQTIANRVSVAKHIPPKHRRASLPFGVHSEVAYLEPADRDRWLDRAELGAWTRAKLRQEMGRDPAPSLGLVDDLIATGKIEADAGDANGGASSTVAREERSALGVPAVRGDFLGDPVLGPKHICPACGVIFSEDEEPDISES